MADTAPSPPEAAPVPPATERFADQVGDDARTRPAPRLSRALGAFAALAGVPALASLVGEIVTGDASKGVGFVAFGLYGAGGVAVLLKGGPSRRTAGVVALAASIPFALGYVIFSDDGFSTSEPTTVLALSTVAWAALHVAGPARGHGALLAAALAGAWATIVVQTGIDAVAGLDPFGPFGFGNGGPSPDTATPAIVSLVFGAGYLGAGFGLDRAGLAGTATSFLGVGIAATALGIVVAGATMLLARPFPDSAEAASIVVLAFAAAVILVLPVLADALGEADDPPEPALEAQPDPEPDPGDEPVQSGKSGRTSSRKRPVRAAGRPSPKPPKD